MGGSNLAQGQQLSLSVRVTRNEQFVL